MRGVKYFDVLSDIGLSIFDANTVNPVKNGHTLKRTPTYIKRTELFASNCTFSGQSTISIYSIMQIPVQSIF